MSDIKPLENAFFQHANFSIHAVDERHFALAAAPAAAAPLLPNLGPLSAFAGTFTGE